MTVQFVGSWLQLLGINSSKNWNASLLWVRTINVYFFHQNKWIKWIQFNSVKKFLKDQINCACAFVLCVSLLDYFTSDCALSFAHFWDLSNYNIMPLSQKKRVFIFVNVNWCFHFWKLNFFILRDLRYKFIA